MACSLTRQGIGPHSTPARWCSGFFVIAARVGMPGRAGLFPSDGPLVALTLTVRNSATLDSHECHVSPGDEDTSCARCHWAIQK